MEESLKLVFIAAVVLFSIIRQVRKAAQKGDVEKESVPMPEPWQKLEWEETEEPQQQPLSPKQSPAVKAKTPKPAPSAPVPQAPLLEEVADETSEFAIRDVEEARRAIIYSEILQRKYE